MPDEPRPARFTLGACFRVKILNMHRFPVANLSGITDIQIGQMMVDNPRNLFMGR